MGRINPTYYYCSIHGNEGNPNCKECWKNLLRMFNDAEANVIADEKTREHHLGLYKIRDKDIPKDLFKKTKKDDKT